MESERVQRGREGGNLNHNWRIPLVSFGLMLSGHCAVGWEPVKSAFTANFSRFALVGVLK